MLLSQNRHPSVRGRFKRRKPFCNERIERLTLIIVKCGSEAVLISDMGGDRLFDKRVTGTCQPDQKAALDVGIAATLDQSSNLESVYSWWRRR